MCDTPIFGYTQNSFMPIEAGMARNGKPIGGSETLTFFFSIPCHPWLKANVVLDLEIELRIQFIRDKVRTLIHKKSIRL